MRRTDGPDNPDFDARSTIVCLPPVLRSLKLFPSLLAMTTSNHRSLDVSADFITALAMNIGFSTNLGASPSLTPAADPCMIAHAESCRLNSQRA